MTHPRRPRVARALARLCLGAHTRDTTVGDLDDQYDDEIYPSRGAPFARLWYWREAMSLSVWALRSRIMSGPVVRRRRPSLGDVLGAEVRQAIRRLVAAPGYTLAVSCTLAAAVGANVIVFAVVNGVLLRPLPYSEPSSILRVSETRPGPEGTYDTDSISISSFRYWREHAELLEEMALYASRDATLHGIDEPEKLRGAAVSPALFRLLGATAEVGRTFRDGEETPGNDGVVVLSRRAFNRHFGTTEPRLGESLMLGERSYVLIGVLPVGFGFPQPDTDFWVPLPLRDVPPGPTDGAGGFDVFVGGLVKLADGASIEQAEAEANAIVSAFEPRFGTPGRQRQLRLVSLHDQIVAPVRRSLWLLAAAVATVLMIACSNLAGLMLGRGMQTRRETAVRVALGAGRGRLALTPIVEALLLAACGGIGGLGLAIVGIRALVLADPVFLPRVEQISVDPAVVVFSVGVSALAGLAFGLVPALAGGRLDPHRELQRASFPLGRSLLTRTLVVIQLALAMVLLVNGGLLARSFGRLAALDRGYDAVGLLTAGIEISGARRGSPVPTLEAILDRAKQHPGLEGAAVADVLPTSRASSNATAKVDGRRRELGTGEAARVDVRVVSHEFFALVGVRLLEGRLPGAREAAASHSVAVVNQTAQRLLSDRRRRLDYRLDVGAFRDLSVVGVVEDFRPATGDSSTRPEVFVLLRQLRDPVATLLLSRVHLVTRDDGDGLASIAALRSVLGDEVADAVLVDVGPLSSRVAAAIAEPRFYASLASALALVALTIGAVGVSGLVAQGVQRRRHEIGVRRALGATTSAILETVLGEALVLVTVGLTLGVGGALLAARALLATLYETTPADPLTLLAATATFCLVATVAAVLPARGSVRIEPTEVLSRE